MMPENRIYRDHIRMVCAIICLLSFLCTSTQAQAQESYAALGVTGLENEIPTQLIRKFQRDAARLALRIESEKQDLRTMNISISKGSIDVFFNMLTQIYLQDETARSIARCNVHTFANPSTDQITVVYDKNVEWASQLRQGTGQAGKVTELLERYDLIIEKHIQWNDAQEAIAIRSVEPLNMAALANEFYKIPGVASIDLNLPAEPGNDIQVRRGNGGWEISYIMRFGEIKGDIKAHVWTYQVLDNGVIRLHSETGAPIPASMRCDLFNGQVIATRL